MRQILFLTVCALMGMCCACHSSDRANDPADSTNPKREWTQKEVLDSTNPNFPNYPNPRYMEYFLRYDDGCYGDIYDTLNILLTTSASINGLPQTICGKSVRYYRNWEEIEELTSKGHVFIQEFGYEIKADIYDNPQVYIGVHFVEFDANDMIGSCHTFEEQEYIDSVLQSHKIMI